MQSFQYVRTHSRKERSSMIEVLEKNGYSTEQDYRNLTKQDILESKLPFRVDATSKTYGLMGNVTCAAAAASSNALTEYNDFILKPDILENMIENLLETSFWIIDVLPRRVSKARAKQYSDLEKVFLHSEELLKKHYNIILKLNCYYNLKMVDFDGHELGDADPEKLSEYIGHKPVYFLFEDSLISLDPDDMHMTLYNPSKTILSTVKQIATSEGMFLWKPGK